MFLIAGPCAIESREIVLHTAGELKRICDELHIPLIFKSSFDKANRTSNSARGIGMEAGLRILQEVKDTYHLPILTDVHESWQCEPVATVADVLQIPAFLSRQTDLIVAAARTGRIVNVKKGQFMAPWDMRGVIEKYNGAVEDIPQPHHSFEGLPAQTLWLTERGSSFGYGNIIVDMTSFVEMRKLGHPVIFDATHAVQKPSSGAGITGGNREMVPYLMRAALAVGIDGIFVEVHPDPDKAISDAANQLCLTNVREILQQALAIEKVVHSFEPIPAYQTASVPETFSSSMPKIKLLLTDVDGVLTDGGMYYGNLGDELKRFQVKDGMGLQLLQKAGVKVGIITSENTPLMERRAKKLGVDYLYQGKRDGGKLEIAREICAKEGISLAEVAYIGDDVNCLEILQGVGFAACPADAIAAVKAVKNIHILAHRGGEGCVRELCEMILNTL